jgi:hypothetical protein
MKPPQRLQIGDLVECSVQEGQGTLLTILCTGAFLYERYSFLLISNKFCHLSLLHCVGRGQWCKKNLLHRVPSLSPKAKLCALEAYIKLPMNLWPVRRAFDAANPLSGQVERGWALES